MHTGPREVLRDYPSGGIFRKNKLVKLHVFALGCMLLENKQVQNCCFSPPIPDLLVVRDGASGTGIETGHDEEFKERL
eukprot:1758262-Pyramimonas_sp.AAC.2